MSETDWRAFYTSDLQAVYSLWLVPLAFLAYRAAARPDYSRSVVPAAAPFVAVATLVFAIETLVDPVATGPLLKKTALGDTIATSLVPLLFVFLGDFRVFLIAAGVARPNRALMRHLRWAAALALPVPIFAGVGFEAIRWFVPDVMGQVLWMLHEAAFLAVCIGLGRLWVPSVAQDDPGKAAFLRTLFGYSAAYYALWLSADVVIAGLGLDLGWALRVVPNQLYYAFWVPFVYWRFFSIPATNAAR